MFINKFSQIAQRVKNKSVLEFQLNFVMYAGNFVYYYCCLVASNYNLFWGDIYQMDKKKRVLFGNVCNFDTIWTILI